MKIKLKYFSDFPFEVVESIEIDEGNPGRVETCHRSIGDVEDVESWSCLLNPCLL